MEMHVMKTVIVYKWARNAEDAAVRSDGSVDWRNAKMTPGEDDFAALEAAKEIAGQDPVVGMTIGDGDASWVLARGVKESTSVADAPKLVDNASTASILASAIKNIGDVDVVAIGDSNEYSGVPVALAGLLGWPVLTDVDTACAEDGKVRVTRKLGSQVQTLSIAAPAVIAVKAASREKQAPGMKEQLLARKRPISKLALSDLGLDGNESLSCAATRLPEAKAARIFEGEPDAAATQLVAALRDEGIL
jgi:electron transfer flavoprotein beta subunit